MEAISQFIEQFRQTILFPISIGVLIAVVAFLVRRVIYIQVSKWAKKTKGSFDDSVIAAGKVPSLFWIAMIAIYGALQFANVREDLLDILNKTLLVLAILSITIFLANMAVRLIQSYSARVNAASPVSSITQNIARVLIFVAGILIIINALGKDITPILATLGVGGLAVALALQETLSNLFAGFYIAVSRQIKIGDYVKLDTGEEGYVTDIHWRTTTIRALANNVVLIPNERLSRAIVVNYYMPEREVAVLVNVGVHYRSDLNKVERVTIEVAGDVMKTVEGGVPAFEPFIRYNDFGDSAIKFTVIMRGQEFTSQYLVKHEFIKRLHARYQQEGIVVPFPIRAINYEQEKTPEQ